MLDERLKQLREDTRWGPWLRLLERLYPAVSDLFSNEVYVLVSAIALNALLSFFPFVVLIVSISSHYFPEWNVHTMIFQILREYLPSNQSFIIDTLRRLARGTGRVQILSMLILLWSISGVFIPLEMTLNRVWNAPKARGFWESQRLAIMMVFLCGVLTFLFVGLAGAVQGLLIDLVGTGGIAASVVRFTAIKLTMVPLTLVICFLLFYLVPNTKVPAHEVLPAAVFTGLVWEFSKYVFVWMLPLLGLGELYGAFVVTVTLVTWAYVGGIILVLGATLTAQKIIAAPSPEAIFKLIQRTRERRKPVKLDL